MKLLRESDEISDIESPTSRRRHHPLHTSTPHERVGRNRHPILGLSALVSRQSRDSAISTSDKEDLRIYGINLNGGPPGRSCIPEAIWDHGTRYGVPLYSTVLRSTDMRKRHGAAWAARMSTPWTRGGRRIPSIHHIRHRLSIGDRRSQASARRG